MKNEIIREIYRLVTLYDPNIQLEDIDSINRREEERWSKVESLSGGRELMEFYLMRVRELCDSKMSINELYKEHKELDDKVSYFLYGSTQCYCLVQSDSQCDGLVWNLRVIAVFSRFPSVEDLGGVFVNMSEKDREAILNGDDEEFSIAESSFIKN